MKIRTLWSLIRSGQLAVMLSMTRLVGPYHRVAFVASGLSSGWLRKLAAGPVALQVLAADLGVDAALRDGLEAWLQLGVALGELRSGPDGYTLRGKLSRTLTDPANDAAAAFIEEVALLHNTLISESPNRLRQGNPFTLADQDARMIARSSRLAEPFICEALDAVIPPRGPLRLLEIGCGTAAYIRYAAGRNAELTALGIDLQAGAAALAGENIAKWNLAARVTIECGDVTQRTPAPVFDVATLHQNIYYFPVEQRVGVLRHVRGFLKPGGRLLLTTICQGPGTGGILSLWGAMTAGCGRLPTPAEMVAQLDAAGFSAVTRRSLVPNESFYAFVGVVR
ncbi:MAG: SAM-dependent methyltransferase [Candidatus Binatia bacterium]